MTLRIDMSSFMSTYTPVILSGYVLLDPCIDTAACAARGLQHHLLYSRHGFHNIQKKFACRTGRSQPF